jgi:hypothetical protein
VVRDYSNRYGGVVKNKQRIVGRRPRSNDPARIGKIIGIVAVIAVVIGVGCSVWFGLALRVSLSELGKGKALKQDLIVRNKDLKEQRGYLLKQEKIEAAARNLGLYPPDQKQLRRP